MSVEQGWALRAAGYDADLDLLDQIATNLNRSTALESGTPSEIVHLQGRDPMEALRELRARSGAGSCRRDGVVAGTAGHATWGIYIVKVSQGVEASDQRRGCWP